MGLSPRSAVSSDQYSPSEQALPQGLPNQVQDGSPKQDSFSEQTPAGKEGSEYSDVVQGLSCVVDVASRPSSTITTPTLNGTLHESSHKRKREQDANTYLGTQEQSLKNHTHGEVVPPGNGNVQAGYQDHVLNQAEESTDDRARFKRSKTIKNEAVRTAAHLLCKSSALPSVLWQHIFCFVPPVFLGRLLRVNHAFNTYLTPSKSNQDVVRLTHSIMQPLDAEAIWVASRRRFCPGLPKPIHGLQELDMWKLLRGQDCQICGQIKAASPAVNAGHNWESGPGEFAVKVVWPFGVRCCGPCLQKISKKELEISLSTDCPFFLLQALPFAFITEANHYIAHSAVRNNLIPPIVRMTKQYYKPHVEEVKRQLESAKELASAEEWTKGLARQGQERLEDILRWEQWESKGGLKKVNLRPSPKATIAGAVTAGSRSTSEKGEYHSNRSTPQSMAFSTRFEAGQPSPGPSLALGSARLASNLVPPPFQSPWKSSTPLQSSMQYVNQFSLYQSKPERNIRDVNEAKATRRAEIERRCAALENPLLPSVLRHMESFQAAMQISQPMTDQAWQILKPRLLAQLPYAERREKELIQQTELLAEEYKQRRQQEAQLKETKENFDREWETFQAPVRKRIGAYADEIIESTWAGGKSVTKEISPKFAADVLLHVRQRFYSATAQEDKAALAAGDPVKTDLPNGPPTRKLMLENMKWVFDSKIKPLTDHFQRELFLCNGCDGNYKFYGFEGVIQHYAAKHTTTLSMGNIVVHWRSEWPEHPPFNPNPSIAKAAYYKVPTPAPPFLPVSSKTPHGTMSYGNRNQGAEAVISGESRQHTTPSYSADGYPTAYKAHHQGATPQSLATQAFPPPSTIHGVSTGYSGAQHEFVANSAITYNLAAAQHEGQIPQHGSSYPSQHAYPSYSQETPGTKFQAYLPGPTTNAYGIHPAASYPLHFSNAPLASHPPAAHNVSGPVSDLYQRQMEEMAKHAKDVFTGIGGVKDLPGSVRIFVVIQHTVSRFKTTFPNEPSLSMFIDGLDHNAVMRPVRSVNGLGCRTCIKNGTGAKLFTLPHLVNHFRTAHVETAQTLGFSQIQELDWKHDMIDLPDVSVISKLIDAAGMTDSKLALLAFVFPAAFPSPLPNLRGRTHIGPQPTYKKELDQNTKSGVATNATSTCSQFEGKSGVQSLVQPYSDFRPLSRGPSEPLEPPGDDEYDPHRPMDLGKIVKIEPSHSQFRKFSKPSPQQDGNRQSLHIPQGTHRHSMHTRVVETRPYSEISSNEISEGYTGHHYGQKKQGTQPHSAVPDDLSRPVSLLVQRDGGHFRSSRQVDLTGYDDMEYPSISYRRTPNGSGLEVSRKTIGRRAQSLSPPEAVDSVDEILSTLPPRSEVGYSHEPYQLDREPERHSQDLWPSQTQLKRRPKYFGADGNCDQWLEAEDSIKRRGDDLDSDGARSGPLVPRNGSETVFPQRSGSYLQYYDDSLPVGQIHLRPIRADESPPVRYASYRNNDQIPGERQQREYSDLRRPRSGSHSYRMSRMPQYRNEVETSPEIPVETALYRPRSPVEEDRGGSVYHVRSPSRKGDHSQTIVSYPTHLRYEYVNDSVLSENHNQQRIEYLPVRYEDPRLREPTRYVLARPVQQVDVRYEHTYAPEPVYERSGQMYHAPTKAYQEPHSWEASSYTQSHQY